MKHLAFEKAKTNDHEMPQSERKFPILKPSGEKSDNRVLTQRGHIVSRVSSYFIIGGHSVTRTELNICKFFVLKLK